MKTTFKKKALLGALGLATLGVFSASAMGFGGMGANSNLSADEIATRQTAMFAQQASLIGTSVDEVKTAWAEGKNLMTLAQEKGLTKEQVQAKMKTLRNEQMKTHLATLVTKGVITQAQADKRLSTMQTKQAAKTGGMGRGGHGGMMGGFGL